MDKKLTLLLGFHSHIPLQYLSNGNNNSFLEEHSHTLNSLINLLHKNKTIKTTLHFSGNFINYLDQKIPDFTSRLGDLIHRNQLELLSGGLYEPLFPLIPRDDRQLQIQLMSRMLNHMFGSNPTGVWITESAWESSLALDLAKSRILYTCLPKEHFINAGLSEEDITGYYITEDEGRKVGVFPIDFLLNDLENKFSPEEAIKFLVKHKEEYKKKSILIFQNSLTFTPERLEWLKSFFDCLEKNDSNVETNILNDYFTNTKPKGRIYLSLVHKSKHTPDCRYWKHTLVKYPEANLLHKKMLRVSKKINSAKEGKSRFKVIKEMINNSHELLLKGQTNNSYWDNDLAGIYLPEERFITYENLIKAENLIERASSKNLNWVQVSESDYDCDGNDEIIIETETQNVYLSPALGGAILEHDYRPLNINLINTISRRYENYHESLEDSQFKDSKLVYDKYLKVSLLDHFFTDNINIEKCVSNTLTHLTDEVIIPYNVETIKAKEQTSKVTFFNDLKLTKLNPESLISIKKVVSTRIGESSLIVSYDLNNKSDSEIKFVFGVEFNLNIFTKRNQKCFAYLNGDINNKSENPDLYSIEEIKSINQINLVNEDKLFEFSLNFSNVADLYKFPIETLSFNQRNLEKVYQGTTLLPVWNVVIKPNQNWELTISQNVIDKNTKKEVSV